MAICNINIATGSVYQSRVDLLLRGPIPFRFERNYDSARVENSALGHGWQHSQMFSLVLSDQEALFMSGGKRVSVPHPDFPANGNKLRTRYDGKAIILIDA